MTFMVPLAFVHPALYASASLRKVSADLRLPDISTARQQVALRG
jgi:hypothetical protein